MPSPPPTVSASPATIPFVDGNKRVAAIATETFLVLNDVALTADDTAFVLTFLSLAAGELSEEALAAWLREHSEKL